MFGFSVFFQSPVKWVLFYFNYSTSKHTSWMFSAEIVALVPFYHIVSVEGIPTQIPPCPLQMYITGHNKTDGLYIILKVWIKEKEPLKIEVSAYALDGVGVGDSHSIKWLITSLRNQTWAPLHGSLRWLSPSHDRPLY